MKLKYKNDHNYGSENSKSQLECNEKRSKTEREAVVLHSNWLNSACERGDSMIKQMKKNLML